MNQDKDEIIYYKKSNTIKKVEPYLIAVLTQAKLSRPNNKTLLYGGIYSSTYPVNIKGYAYLIRKKDKKIIKSASCSANSTTSKTLSKSVKIDKGDNKYYCRAVGVYTTKSMGTKQTSQSTTSIY